MPKKYKKQDVLSVAIELFSIKGISNTSVEDILKKAGMSRGTFYKLFHSKDDILSHIAELAKVARIDKFIPQRVPGWEKRNDREKLEGYFDYVFGILSDFTNPLYLVYVQSWSSPSIQALGNIEINQHYLATHEFFLAIFKGMDVDDPAVAARMCVTFMDGIWFQYSLAFTNLEYRATYLDQIWRIKTDVKNLFLKHS